jgi:uncharacterized protein
MTSKHPIPIDVLNQHLIVLGKTGAGKSSAMRVMVEQLLDAGKRVCIVDIKGDWYGIKLSADGKEAGYPLVAFGDFKNPDATDIHITENHGIEIAKLVTGGNRPCLIGFRGWMPGKVHKFWIDFISTVYNTNQSPLWIIIDEVHNYTPKGKVLSPEIGNSIYWTNKITTEGRGIGLRVIAGSQRPAKTHNDFLANCETLVAMRVTLPADKKAFHDWMKEYSDDDARGKMVLDSVSKMKTGEAFVWSPEAEIFEQLKFPLFKTFDSFASPKEGKQKQLKGWAEVNLDEVKEKLSKVIEETKDNDPTELKKKIRELQIEVNKKLKLVPQTSTIQVDQHAIDKAVEQIRSQYEAKIDKAKKEIEIIRHALGKKVVDVFLAAKALEEVEFPTFTDKIRALDLFKAEARKELTLQKPSVKPIPERSYQPIIDDLDRNNPPQGTDKLPSGARRLLEVLVSWHPNSLTEGHWRSNAGLRKTGTFSNYKSMLLTSGMIKKDGEKFIATQVGIDYFGDHRPRAPQTTEEVLALWNPKLPEGARRMLQVLIKYFGESISEGNLLEQARLRKTGTFSNYKSMLITAKLIKKDGDQLAADKETLFL